MIRKFSIASICLIIFGLNGCLQFALRASPKLVSNFAASIFEECDPELAKNAIPANLKLMEGLLKNDPKNKQILTSLAMGFSGYSMLFVEADDPERGSKLYLRARDYGIDALGDKGIGLKNTDSTKENIQTILKAMGKEDIEALFWTTVSWNAWINLNLDKPAALAQLSIPQACLERVMEIDAEYLHGLPNILMGVSLAARPKMLGGDMKQSRYYFEKGLAVSQGKLFLGQYYFARYYTVRAQDRKLFSQLIQDIINGNPRGLEDVCLINAVMQMKARELRKTADELFF